MKRITVFMNGSNISGKVMVVNSLSQLLFHSSEAFHIPAKHIYNQHGGVIDDYNLLREDDVVYITDGEPFILPSCTQIKKTVGDEWVMLNVGGKVFQTTKSTLISKEPDSMLSRMFKIDDSVNCLQPSIRDSLGSYLIDRSYVYFEPILNYLRTGILILDPNVNPQGVLEEAKFYSLDSVVRELESLMETSSKKRDLAEPLSRSEVISALITTQPSHELRFQAVIFREADLSKLDLRNINFKYADFTDANLSGANLTGCNLERAILRRANLEGAQLLNVKLLNANLENANLRYCNFEDPCGHRANCEGVNLNGAVLEGSMMAGVNLRVAKLKNCNLRGCDLRAAVLAGADLENSDMTGSNLQEANLRGANLKGVAFESMQNPLHMSQTCDL